MTGIWESWNLGTRPAKDFQIPAFKQLLPLRYVNTGESQLLLKGHAESQRLTEVAKVPLALAGTGITFFSSGPDNNYQVNKKYTLHKYI